MADWAASTVGERAAALRLLEGRRAQGRPSRPLVNSRTGKLARDGTDSAWPSGSSPIRRWPGATNPMSHPASLPSVNGTVAGNRIGRVFAMKSRSGRADLAGCHQCPAIGRSDRQKWLTKLEATGGRPPPTSCGFWLAEDNPSIRKTSHGHFDESGEPTWRAWPPTGPELAVEAGR